MIKFINDNNQDPYIKFKKIYLNAVKSNQNMVEAICISSYNKCNDEVDSRFVNLKYVDNDNFIFFTNYNSSKSEQFSSHNQIAATVFWDSINVQIRIKANIKKKSPTYNKQYFKSRSIKKNALAISSNQSKKITSYQKIIDSYKTTLNNNNLLLCPDYWGGFSFKPYSFEFWEGHNSRINKRELYELTEELWNYSILEP